MNTQEKMNWYFQYLFKAGSLIRYLFLISVVISFVGCSKFFEKDLSGKKVSVLVPQDSLITYISTIQFQWEELDGAQQYHLQIATPTFATASEIILDTLISNTTFSYSLYPGVFEWRLRGENSSSESDYGFYQLRIDSTLDLTNQTLLLDLPIDNWATSESEINFEWNELYNAENYDFVLRNDNWSGDVVQNLIDFEPTSTSVDSMEEGNYCWGVRANGNGTSTEYAIRYFKVDQTIPQLSSMLLPEDDATVTSPVVFSWSRVDDNGSSINDSLFLYSNSGLTALVQALRVTSTSQNVSLLPGTYYWRLKTIDQANNQSSFSSSRELLVEN